IHQRTQHTSPNTTLFRSLSVSDAPPGQPFNFAAFAIPAAGQWGNAARDSIIGPNQFSLNASLSRVIRVGERHNIDIRFDAQNARSEEHTSELQSPYDLVC